MSKYRRVRAEDEAEDEEWWRPTLTDGHAVSTVEAEAATEHFAAMLWLPDPESRRGWAMHGVERKAEPKPRQPFGFKQGG